MFFEKKSTGKEQRHAFATRKKYFGISSESQPIPSEDSKIIAMTDKVNNQPYGEGNTHQSEYHPIESRSKARFPPGSQGRQATVGDGKANQ